MDVTFGGVGSLSLNETSVINAQTYNFLKQKLRDANATITSYVQRETNWRDEIDQLKHENDEKQTLIGKLKNELQTAFTKHIQLEEKAESETRQKFDLQDQVSNLESDLDEKSTRSKYLESQLKEANSSLKQTEDLVQTVYNIAQQACTQSQTMKEQIQVLEEMVNVLKKKNTELQSEYQKAKSDFIYVKESYDDLEGNFETSLHEIKILKEEASKQDNYINETLNRFKEIGVHFSTMKTHFLKQHKTLEKYEQEITRKQEDKTCKSNAYKETIREHERRKQEASLREVELQHKLDTQEKAMNAVLSIRQHLEKQNKTYGDRIGEMTEQIHRLECDKENLTTLQHVHLEKIKEKDLTLETSKKEIEILSKKYEELQTNKAVLQQDYTKMKCSHETLSQEKNALHDEYAQIKETYERLNEKNMKLHQDYSFLCEKLSNQDREIASILNERDNIEECLSGKHEEFVRLKRQCDILQNEKNKIESALLSTTKEKARLERLVKQSETAKQELENKINKHKNSASEIEDRLSNVQTEYEKLKTNLQNEKIKFSNLSTRIEELQLAHAETIANLDSMTKENKDLKRNCEMLSAEKETIQVKLNENVKRLSFLMDEQTAKLNAELYKQTEKIKSLEGDLNLRCTKLESTKSQLAKEREEREKIRQAHDKFRHDVMTLRQEKQSLAERLEKMSTDMEKISSDNQEMTMEREKLLHDLQKKQHEHSQLMDEVSSVQREWDRLHEQTLQDLKHELHNTKLSPIKTGDSLWDDI